MRLSLTSRLLASGLALAAACVAAPSAVAQRDGIPEFLLNPAYYSSRTVEKKAVMNGNEVAITFFNYGLLAGVGEIRGNWPKGSNDFYVGDVLPIIAAEVPVNTGTNCSAPANELVRHVVSTRGPGNRGINTDPDSPSIAWTFEAKRGFAATGRRDDTSRPNDRVATSTDFRSWPERWPDQPAWLDPTTGRAQWNGYFGRNQFNADLESYFWADDRNDAELRTQYPCFRADATDPTRNGLGLDLKVRGLQWSQFLAQDAIFWLYEVTNSSTTTYPRVAVGLTVGTLSGGDGDTQDDLAFFDQANRIVYSYDNNNRGNQGQPVGYVGYGFLESPGNADNGIDDDGDGDPTTPAGLDVFGAPFVMADAGTDNTFAFGDFAPRVLAGGDPLVLIDAATGRRSVQYVPASGAVTVVSQGQSYTVAAGRTIEEATTQVATRTQGVFQTLTAKDLIDQDLDGIVDEDVTLHFTRRAQSFGVPPTIVTLPALKYENYADFARAVRGRQPTVADSSTYGLLNRMIDEDRNDGRDNDGDWSAIGDDVGADGQPGTGDAGEGNGRPSAGEPNFDDLDVDESDQVGLSSFYYFVPSNAFPISNDEQVWGAMTPGFFTTNDELTALQAGGGADGDFVFGSGYFPLPPGETLRFTLALVFGADLEDITTNQITIQEIYDRNYQFSRPPDRPTLRAVPGDGQVTLYWDSAAENSIDPILGRDFQGYRLYRSTDPFFRDVPRISDAFGNEAIRVPFAVFDKADGIKGIYTSNDPRVRGVPYALGEDTGLRYSFVDTDVDNGQRYFYAIAAYDAGSSDATVGIFYPAENDIPVNVREDGTVTVSQNVVEVTPNAGVAGLVRGSVSEAVVRSAGAATGGVFTEILDPRLVRDGASYTVRFNRELAADSFFVFRDGTRVAAERLDAAGTSDRPGSVIVDGVRLSFNNDATRLDADSTATGYTANRRQLTPAEATLAFSATIGLQGVAVPFDYEIRFLPGTTSASVGGFRIGTRANAPLAVARQTNVEVFNTTLNRRSEFVFLASSGNDGVFSATRNGPSDIVIVYETIAGVRTPTYLFQLRSNASGAYEGRQPTAGDVFRIGTRKPFSVRDEYRFRTAASAVDPAAAATDIERVRVVPNPYVAAASWERDNPQGVTGRGERRIDFTHLPAGARIRIYNVRGALVRELTHDGSLDDGTVSWDLRTRENLETAYGIYFYHVEAPDGATKTGRLALIK